MIKVFISIINFNGNTNTKYCLKSLQKVQKKTFELHTVVIDNNSSEKFTIKKDFFQDINLSIIKNSYNAGFSGGHNVGIAYALKNGADYILLLNNDTTVHPKLIEELLATAVLNDRIGIVVPKIYFAPGSEFHKERYKKNELGKVIWYAGGVMDWANVLASHKGVDIVDHGQYDHVEETEFATGCCMLVRADIFEKIGTLNEDYFLYYEDNDFSQRVQTASYRIMYAPKAMLWHENAGSSGGSGSDLQDYFITRNRLIFGFKYAPWRAKLALARESIRIFFSGRKLQKQAIRDFCLKKLGKGTFLNNKSLA